nr:PREDICTED: tumor necrosis factor ligand superfamily member 18-like [Struthio camelus australis]
MEAPNLLENGNIPQKRKFSCSQVAFYASAFLLTLISVLAPIVFCVLHHKQAPGTCWAHASLKVSSTPTSEVTWTWEWNLTHCDGFVEKDPNHLTIMESGNYFIYAQVNRKKDMNESFTVVLYKEPDILLNKVVGLNVGVDKATISFGRPFSLHKGDKLCCKMNFKHDYILAENQTYWGLYKI